MIDFRKELLKFKPAKEVEDLHGSITLNEVRDINELLHYLARLPEPDGSERQPLTPSTGDKWP